LVERFHHGGGEIEGVDDVGTTNTINIQEPANDLPVSATPGRDRQYLTEMRRRRREV